MDLKKCAEGNTFSPEPCGTISIGELADFLQDKPDVNTLALVGRNIGDQSILELSKLKNLTSFTLLFDHISSKRAKELTEFTDTIQPVRTF